jgi:hypothetical protein
VSYAPHKQEIEKQAHCAAHPTTLPGRQRRTPTDNSLGPGAGTVQHGALREACRHSAWWTEEKQLSQFAFGTRKNHFALQWPTRCACCHVEPAMDKDQRRNLPKKKEKQKLPRLERLLSPILEWDDWTAAHIVVFTRVGLLVKEKRLRPPSKSDLWK